MIKKIVLSTCFIFLLSFLSLNSNFAKTYKRSVSRSPIERSLRLGSDSNQIWGIDISHHQCTIDWNILEKNKPNFMYLKVTEGATHTDKRYLTHIKEARKLNIPCGAYHFFGYTSSGKTQAQYFIKNAKLQKGDLHPVLDVEFTRSTHRARMNISKEIMAFCKEIYKEFNVYPIIYCNESYFNRYLKKQFSNYNFWICDYRKKPFRNYVFWQHTDKAKVKGIKGYVDRNWLHPEKTIENFVLK